MERKQKRKEKKPCLKLKLKQGRGTGSSRRGDIIKKKRKGKKKHTKYEPFPEQCPCTSIAVPSPENAGKEGNIKQRGLMEGDCNSAT